MIEMWKAELVETKEGQTLTLPKECRLDAKSVCIMDMGNGLWIVPENDASKNFLESLGEWQEFTEEHPDWRLERAKKLAEEYGVELKI